MGEGSVAIDGPVASGKSTAARAVAERLGFPFIDTGAMYRALTAVALRERLDGADEDGLVALLDAVPIAVEPDAHTSLGYRIRCSGEDVTETLFVDAVSRAVSTVAAHAGVRAEMLKRQRRIAAAGPVVMAGRDIGTVVLPEADCKVFLTASVPTRVERRAAELEALGHAVDRTALRAEIEGRDRADSSRPVAPLRPAADAVVVDSSDLSIEQVVERILALRARALATG